MRDCLYKDPILWSIAKNNSVGSRNLFLRGAWVGRVRDVNQQSGGGGGGGVVAKLGVAADRRTKANVDSADIRRRRKKRDKLCARYFVPRASLRFLSGQRSTSYSRGRGNCLLHNAAARAEVAKGKKKEQK